MVHRDYRRKLPDERAAITHKFSITGFEGYITVGLFPNGEPGEIFICMSKQGSTISGLLDAFAIQTSLALQYNVPLDVMVEKFRHMRFEPSDFKAKSIIDYVFKWLALKFLPDETADQWEAGKPLAESEPAMVADMDDTGDLEERHNEKIGLISPPELESSAVDPMLALASDSSALDQAREISETLAPIDPTKANGSDDIPLMTETETTD